MRLLGMLPTGEHRHPRHIHLRAPHRCRRNERLGDDGPLPNCEALPPLRDMVDAGRAHALPGLQQATGRTKMTVAPKMIHESMRDLDAYDARTAEMRGWLLDCFSETYAVEAIEAADAFRIRRYVAQHYVGGVAQFERDGE